MSIKRDCLPTCDPRLCPVVANTSYPFTSRRAVDSSGRVGSFYDASCDQVIHTSKLDLPTQLVRSQGSLECYLPESKLEKTTNLLEYHNIHHELRLSIALQIAPEMGIGTLINYSHPIDKYTRCICYYYVSRTEYLSNEQFDLLCSDKSRLLATLATHVIVLVNWGIDALVILQLPPDDKVVKKIDHVLEKLCTTLSKNQSNIRLSENDQHVLGEIAQTEVFSNIPDLSKLHSVVGFYNEIRRVKNESALLKPYNYSLCAIQHLNSMNHTTQSIFNKLPKKPVIDVELHLLQLSHNFKRLNIAMNQNYPHMQQHLKDYLVDTRLKWSNLEKMYRVEIQRISNLVIDIRRNKIKRERIYQALNNEGRKKLLKSIDDFDFHLKTIQEKEHLLDDLRRNNFTYRCLINHEMRQDDDKETIEQKLVQDKERERIICSNNNLYKNSQSQWRILCYELLKEREEKPHLQLIYVDFTYSEYELKHFINLPSIEKNDRVDIPQPVTTSPSSSEQPMHGDSINILLFGESGVGKSTFINAFVNYLFFETLEQAQKKSIVVIPVSFLMTTGDDFQEQQVIFGGMDTLSTEDHEHVGQSVTQHCKSYIFTLNDNHNKGTKLCIIDTPGIGDVRGLAQDDLNMQHILSYINNLSHLNAVCILMKPNNSRMNIFFRSCFLQLFDLLGEIACDKVVFCFTNSRSTFYAPGNTAPLLKELLKSLPGNNIPFAKYNTFCFDSEAFRYLVALQNGIQFDEFEEQEYRESWQKSSTESKRFLDYLCTEMATPLVVGERRSVKDVQLRITLMVRPMLEGIRNTFRNIILWNTESPRVSIELQPKMIKCPIAICLKCPRLLLKVGDFWIPSDALHIFHNTCGTCLCSPNDHYLVDYQLEYKLSNHPANRSCDDLITMLDDLYETSAVFVHFLAGSTNALQNDLFLKGLERMIKEEDDVCKTKAPCLQNEKLFDRLTQLKQNYEEKRKELVNKKMDIQLPEVYDKIEQVRRYPMIQSQMDAVEKWHKYIIKYYEYEVPIRETLTSFLLNLFN